MSAWTATAIIVAVIVVSEIGVRIIHRREKDRQTVDPGQES